jgi:regulator of PEP synthase PpsR (kinase-PPPase family)
MSFGISFSKKSRASIKQPVLKAYYHIIFNRHTAGKIEIRFDSGKTKRDHEILRERDKGENLRRGNPPKFKPIFVLSDGTGETAEKVVRAALHQFSGYLVYVQVFPNVQEIEQLQDLMQKASSSQALVVTTLVRSEMRTAAHEMAKQNRIRHTDLIGSLLTQMSLFLRAQPEGVPNQMHQINDEYFRRIEAVEFTVKGDDGKNPKMLHDADIVLLGVSRTSKTPLSVFLAHKGYRVCNVPIVFDRPLPPTIEDIDQRRVIALTIDPDVLHRIRRQRLKTMRVSGRNNYGDIEYILAELDWADSFFRAHPIWPVINVTEKAVEETAAMLLNILSDRGLTKEIGDVGQL